MFEVLESNKHYKIKRLFNIIKKRYTYYINIYTKSFYKDFKNKSGISIKKITYQKEKEHFYIKYTRGITIGRPLYFIEDKKGVRQIGIKQRIKFDL